MSYVVLARRFRPQTFDQVVGQDHVSATLRNAVSAGRLAHAYLFSGPRGVGKTSMARILAKALNCQKSKGPTTDPCGRCDSCVEIAEGRSLDVVEMDAASHTGVDDVRVLKEGVLYASARDRFKVYIIDEVHMMSRSAFNALLKVLEEPPEHVKFIFATTEPERLPDTVLSRCQRFDFRRILTADCLKRLEQIAKSEKLKAEPAALAAIARRARGGLRDAEGLLDQLVSFRGRKKIALADVLEMVGAVSDAQIGKLFAAIGDGRPGDALLVLAECLDAGAELDEVASALADRLRGALLVAVGGKEGALVSGEYAHLAEELAAEAARSGTENLVRMSSVLAEARRACRNSPEPRIVLELALVRLAELPDLLDLRELVARLDAAPAAAPVPRPGPVSQPARPAPDPKPRSSRRPPPGEDISPFSAQESSAPPPPPPSPAPGGPPKNLAAGWSAMRAGLAGSHASVNALLEAFRPVSVDHGRLVLEAGASGSFQREQLETLEKRKVLEAAAAQAFGRPLKVAFAKAAGGAKGKPAGGRKSDVNRAAGEPAVKKLMSKFDGRVVNVRKRKP